MFQHRKSLKILLVEDDIVDVMGFKRALRKSGIECSFEQCSNGQEALELLQTKQERDVPIVVSDLKMPIMDGITLLQEIRKDPRLQKSPVFILSSSDARQDVEMAYRSFATGYVVKPGDSAGLSQFLGFLKQYGEFCESP